MIKKKTLLIIPIMMITLMISLLMPVSVFANENYEPRLEAPSSKISYYSSNKNAYSKAGYGMPNCVAYVYGRVYEMNGEEPKIKKGNASQWYSINKRNNYYDYGQEPKLGAVACWSNHVAIVEKINEDNSITISESHWRGKYFNTATYKSLNNLYGQKFYGYIYTYNESNNESEEKSFKEKIKDISSIDTKYDEYVSIFDIESPLAPINAILKNNIKNLTLNITLGTIG